jgi:protein TonB
VEKRPAPQPVRAPVPLALPAAVPTAAPDSVPPASASAVAAPPVAAPTAPPQPTQPRFDADYLDNPKPTYPTLSRRMGEEGRVVLRVHVAASGLPLDVALHAGSGSSRLDQAALDAVRRWKFVPARLGSETVAATVLVPIVFSLKD